MLTLTQKEQQIIDILLATVNRITQQVQLRIAGGWVRDKLLGLESVI